MKMNKKGFTLIELIATIVIMALILIVVMPSIRALRNNSEKKQYEYYGDSLIEASKIYVNKEGEDITPLGNLDFTGCVDITYQDLIDSDLIKPFTDENIDCSNASIRYTKSEKSSSYNYNMTCTDTRNNKVVYEHKEIEDNSCSIIDADDKTPPTCGEVIGDSTEWTKEDRTITVNCTDDRNGCESVTKTFDSTTKIGYVEIKDGNNNTTSCPVNVYVDKTPPVITSISGNPGCIKSPDTISINLTAEENGSGVNRWQYGYSTDEMIDYANSASTTFTTTPFSVIREQNAYFRVYDNVGNASTFKSTYICIQQADPDINFNLTCGIECYGGCVLNGYWNERIWYWNINGLESSITSATIDYSTSVRPHYWVGTVYGHGTQDIRKSVGYAYFELPTRFRFSTSKRYGKSSIVGEACTPYKCKTCTVYY